MRVSRLRSLVLATASCQNRAMYYFGAKDIYYCCLHAIFDYCDVAKRKAKGAEEREQSKVRTTNKLTYTAAHSWTQSSLRLSVPISRVRFHCQKYKKKGTETAHYHLQLVGIQHPIYQTILHMYVCTYICKYYILTL